MTLPVPDINYTADIAVMHHVAEACLRIVEGANSTVVVVRGPGYGGVLTASYMRQLLTDRGLTTIEAFANAALTVARDYRLVVGCVVDLSPPQWDDAGMIATHRDVPLLVAKFGESRGDSVDEHVEEYASDHMLVNAAGAGHRVLSHLNIVVSADDDTSTVLVEGQRLPLTAGRAHIRVRQQFLEIDVGRDGRNIHLRGANCVVTGGAAIELHADDRPLGWVRAPVTVRCQNVRAPARVFAH